MQMDRRDFEALRDLPDKKIRDDITFRSPGNLSPSRVADEVKIENSDSVDARMIIRHNPETGQSTINVYVAGGGPICRLDVDGPPHRPAGRSHKHSLQTPACPDRNLPSGVLDKPELSGRPIREVFEIFCEMANIEHTGEFNEP